MDYEQDYSKLNAADTQWMNLRMSIRRHDFLAHNTEEETTATSAQTITLDDEDFN